MQAAQPCSQDSIQNRSSKRRRDGSLCSAQPMDGRGKLAAAAACDVIDLTGEDASDSAAAYGRSEDKRDSEARSALPAHQLHDSHKERYAAQIQKQLEALRAELNAARAATLLARMDADRLQAQSKTLQEEKAALDAHIQQQEARVAEMGTTSKEKGTIIQELKTENALLIKKAKSRRAKLAKLTAEAEKGRAECASSRTESERARSECNSARSDLQKLQSQVAQLNAALSAEQTRTRTADARVGEVQAAAEAQLGKLRGAEAQISELRESERKARAEAAAVRQLLSHTERQAAAALKQHSEQAQRADSQLREAREQAQRAELQLRETREQAQRTESKLKEFAVKVKDKVGRLNRRLRTSRRQVAKLRAATEGSPGVPTASAEAALLRSDLKASLEELAEVRRECQQQSSELDASRAEAARLQAEDRAGSGLQLELQQLRSELEASRAEAASLQASAKRLRTDHALEISRLQQQLDSKTQDLTSKTLELERLSAAPAAAAGGRAAPQIPSPNPHHDEKLSQLEKALDRKEKELKRRDQELAQLRITFEERNGSAERAGPSAAAGGRRRSGRLVALEAREAEAALDAKRAALAAQGKALERAVAAKTMTIQTACDFARALQEREEWWQHKIKEEGPSQFAAADGAAGHCQGFSAGEATLSEPAIEVSA